MNLLQENWGRPGYESELAEIVADLARTVVLARAWQPPSAL